MSRNLSHSLPGELELRDGMAITLGIIPGAAIFALPGRVARYAHSFETLPWWIAAGLFSPMGALLYTELAGFANYRGLRTGRRVQSPLRP